MSERTQGEHDARLTALEKLTDQMAGDLREVRDFVLAIKAKWAIVVSLSLGLGAFAGAVVAFLADIAKSVIEKRIAP